MTENEQARHHFVWLADEAARCLGDWAIAAGIDRDTLAVDEGFRWIFALFALTLTGRLATKPRKHYIHPTAIHASRLRSLGKVTEAEIEAAEQFGYYAEARRPLAEHLADFRGFLQAKGRTEQHVNQTTRQIEAIAKACKAEQIAALTRAAVQTAIGEMRDAGKSLRTCNSYLAAVKSFVRWLWKEKRTPDNALAGLSKYNEETDRRHERRELSEDELRWLLVTTEAEGKLNFKMDAETRTMAYRVALGSGFRTNELRTLTPASFHLNADPPTVTAAAAYSKRRRKDVQPIPEGLAERLQPWLANRPRDEQLFRLPHNTSKMFQRDLAAARAAWITEAEEDPEEQERRTESDFLKYQDAAGRYADFYATRHTYIRGIVAGGASVKTAQELARHSTPVLTIGRYSHARLHDLTGALEALPDLQPEDRPEDTTQIQRATGTDSLLPANRQWQAGETGRETAETDQSGGRDEGDAEEPKTIVFPGKEQETRRKRKWSGPGSNRRHTDFQSVALPTELPNHQL